MIWLIASALAADLGGTLAADGLHAPVDAGGLLAVDGARLPERWEARLDASLAHNALMAYNQTEPYALVSDLATLRAAAGLRLGPVRVAGRLPVGALLRAEGLEQPSVAAGDPGLGLLVSPWSGAKVAPALSLDLTLPLGGAALWLGDGGPTLEAAAVLDGEAGPWRLCLNGGVRLQPRVDLVLYHEEEGPSQARQLLTRGALQRLLGQRTHLSLELAGALGLAPFGAAQSSPLEGLLGLQREMTDGQFLRAGLGLGLAPGVGAPAARLMVGVGQAGGVAVAAGEE